MEEAESLIAGLEEEDRQLRQLIAGWPPSLLDQPVRRGLLGPQETLGHLAYWDLFTIRFLEAKLAGDEEFLTRTADFDRRDRQELERSRGRSFADVAAAYGSATAALISFLRARWGDLSERERADLRTPLRHRRHHRLLLAGARGATPPPPPPDPRARQERA